LEYGDLLFDEIENWDKKVSFIYVSKKEWEVKGGYGMRPIKEWFPSSLIPLVRVREDVDSIRKELENKFILR